MLTQPARIDKWWVGGSNVRWRWQNGTWTLWLAAAISTLG